MFWCVWGFGSDWLTWLVNQGDRTIQDKHDKIGRIHSPWPNMLTFPGSQVVKKRSFQDQWKIALAVDCKMENILMILEK